MPTDAAGKCNLATSEKPQHLSGTWNLPLVSEDWALHLTGGLSFYFSTAAANPWDQAKANTDAGLIYLGEGCWSLRRQTSLLPGRNADQSLRHPFWEHERLLKTHP